MKRGQKADLVSYLGSKLGQSELLILLHYRGISDDKLYRIRSSLKSSGMALKIAKNTLVRLAVKGTNLEAVSGYLKGPTAIAYCVTGDPVVLAKIIFDSAKDNQNLKIQAAYFKQSVLLIDDIESFSKLGSLEEVRSSFVGLIKGGQSRFLRVLGVTSSGVLSVMNNYIVSKS